MGSIQIKQVKIKHLPEIYEIHKTVFPLAAQPRYYENLMGVKDSPFYVALNDDDEVVGYIATRYITQYPQYKKLNTVIIPPHLVVAALAVNEADSETENKYEIKAIKELLIDALLVQVRIGGYAYLQADFRESQTESIAIMTEYGFDNKPKGKYKDGETKIRMTYNFDMDKLSTQFRVERATYKHLSRVKRLHNDNLSAKKDYGYFARIMKRKGSLLLVIVDEYDRVIAYLAARRQYKIITDDTTPYTYLNFVSMTVDTVARGNGLGSVLVEQLIDEAKESDVEMIYGHVRESNKIARKLYSKLGFSETNVGQYKDTEEIKYMIRKRIRLPSIKPYVKPTLKSGALVVVGYLLREFQNKLV